MVYASCVTQHQHQQYYIPYSIHVFVEKYTNIYIGFTMAQPHHATGKTDEKQHPSTECACTTSLALSLSSCCCCCFSFCFRTLGVMYHTRDKTQHHRNSSHRETEWENEWKKRAHTHSARKTNWEKIAFFLLFFSAVSLSLSVVAFSCFIAQHRHWAYILYTQCRSSQTVCVWMGWLSVQCGVWAV